MGSDLTLQIFDSAAGTIVCARWLGMSGTLRRVHEVLARTCTTSGPGWECWAGVSPLEAVRIAEARYADGAPGSEVVSLAKAFPTPDFWWLIVRDY